MILALYLQIFCLLGTKGKQKSKVPRFYFDRFSEYLNFARNNAISNLLLQYPFYFCGPYKVIYISIFKRNSLPPLTH